MNDYEEDLNRKGNKTLDKCNSFLNDRVLIETLPPLDEGGEVNERSEKESEDDLRVDFKVNKSEDPMENYFSQNDVKFKKIIEQLESWHHERFDRLDEMDELAKQVVWWPFTQHNKVKKVNVIDSAFEDFMIVYDKNEKVKEEQTIKDEKNKKKRNTYENSGKENKKENWEKERAERGALNEIFDGAASWWTQGSISL